MAPPLHKAIKSPQRFAELVDGYVQQCLIKDDKGKDSLITVCGLALALDCDKGQISKWLAKYEEPTEHDPDCLIAHAIKRAKAHSEHQLQQDCYKSRNSVSLALAKCMYGYVEQQHTIKHEVSGDVRISIDFGVPESKSGY